jgi:hypothetical protein
LPLAAHLEAFEQSGCKSYTAFRTLVSKLNNFETGDILKVARARDKTAEKTTSAVEYNKMIETIDKMSYAFYSSKYEASLAFVNNIAIQRAASIPETSAEISDHLNAYRQVCKKFKTAKLTSDLKNNFANYSHHAENYFENYITSFQYKFRMIAEDNEASMNFLGYTSPENPKNILDEINANIEFVKKAIILHKAMENISNDLINTLGVHPDDHMNDKIINEIERLTIQFDSMMTLAMECAFKAADFNYVKDAYQYEADQNERTNTLEYLTQGFILTTAVVEDKFKNPEVVQRLIDHTKSVSRNFLVKGLLRNIVVTESLAPMLAGAGIGLAICGAVLCIVPGGATIGLSMIAAGIALCTASYKLVNLLGSEWNRWNRLNKQVTLANIGDNQKWLANAKKSFDKATEVIEKANTLHELLGPVFGTSNTAPTLFKRGRSNSLPTIAQNKVASILFRKRANSEGDISQACIPKKKLR